jgi:uncharacterized protein YjiS (DUF1127 family)
MSRLTERELEEIRRVKRAVEAEAREEFSQLRLADGGYTRRPAPAAGLLAQAARISGLAEVAWMVREGVVLPLRQRLHRRRAMAELHGLSDRALKDIGVERGQIDSLVGKMQIATPRAPRPETGLVATLRRWIVRRRAIGALTALDDRLLEDIGLVRAHIPAFVRGLDKAVASGRIDGETAARTARNAGARSGTPASSTLTRQAAHDVARLDPKALADYGYVAGEAEARPHAA